MNSVYDIQQLLKQYGTYIYVGERILDLELMEEEIKELYFAHVIEKQIFTQALMIIRKEIEFERSKKRKRED